MTYTFEIVPYAGPAGGWLLRLLRDGQLIGGGTFLPRRFTPACADAWWDDLSDPERQRWLESGAMRGVATAFCAHLAALEYLAARRAASEWLTTCFLEQS